MRSSVWGDDSSLFCTDKAIACQPFYMKQDYAPDLTDSSDTGCPGRSTCTGITITTDLPVYTTGRLSSYKTFTFIQLQRIVVYTES